MYDFPQFKVLSISGLCHIHEMEVGSYTIFEPQFRVLFTDFEFELHK
jgi:hypothetical protein